MPGNVPISVSYAILDHIGPLRRQPDSRGAQTTVARFKHQLLPMTKASNLLTTASHTLGNPIHTSLQLAKQLVRPCGAATAPEKRLAPFLQARSQHTVACLKHRLNFINQCSNMLANTPHTIPWT
jgi:hypothetical protein